MNQLKTSRSGLVKRLREIRVDRFGEGEAGVGQVASVLEIPPATWRNYESGVTMPAEVLLRLIDETDVDPHWLLTGRGERYSQPDYGMRFRFD
jgi:hypothetical protein